MKPLLKVLTLIAASSCLIFGTAAMAANPTSQSQAAKSAKKAPVKLLFVLQATNGTLTHVKGKQYKLVIPVKGVSPMLAFTDRPNRRAFDIGPKAFTKMIHSGPNSVKKDPLNIALRVGKSPFVAFTIIEYDVTGGNQVYLLQSFGTAGKPLSSTRKNPARGAVALYLDSVLPCTEGAYFIPLPANC